MRVMGAMLSALVIAAESTTSQSAEQAEPAEPAVTSQSAEKQPITPPPTVEQMNTNTTGRDMRTVARTMSPEEQGFDTSYSLDISREDALKLGGLVAGITLVVAGVYTTSSSLASRVCGEPSDSDSDVEAPGNDPVQGAPVVIGEADTEEPGNGQTVIGVPVVGQISDPTTPIVRGVLRDDESKVVMGNPVNQRSE